VNEHQTLSVGLSIDFIDNTTSGFAVSNLKNMILPTVFKLMLTASVLFLFLRKKKRKSEAIA
jgi:hypothetical protein